MHKVNRKVLLVVDNCAAHRRVENLKATELLEEIDEGIETFPSHSESSETQETESERTREDNQGEELPEVTERVSRCFDFSGNIFYAEEDTGSIP